MNISIRKSTDTDLKTLLEVNRKAFNSDVEPQLVNDLLNDDTAAPVFSLVACNEEEIVGHILFSRCTLNGKNNTPTIYILAPLAILPEYQNKGIGGMLINEGHKQLKNMQVDLSCVLGHIDYYPRHGYIKDAKSLGYHTMYPIPEECKDAWMIIELKKGSLKSSGGRVICPKALDKDEYWRE